MPDSKALPRILMLSIAVTQGLVLFALYKSVENDSWPSESPLWSFPLWTLAIVLPVMLLLSLECDREKHSLALTTGFGVILTAVAVYTGWQAMPHDVFPIFSVTGAFVASIAIASFKALMYLQQRASGVPLSYQVLFTYSWRNFLVLSLSALFVLAVWLVLSLWGALFKVIEIDFFARLFREDWFLFPVLSFALGLGVVIFRELTRVIDSITGLLRGLIKLLLPLVVMVAVIFLLALPFTGLDVLWATGRGTALLLWLTAIILFFANAVYQDGRETSPYPAAIHRLIYFGLLALLPLSALSLYGLTLRLDQYGWTVQRSWGMVVWALLTLFSVGYAWGVIRRRDHWPRALAQVNTAMGLVLLGVLLLANSPLLDFRKISLASQLARVESGEIELAALDFYYLKQYLARPGFLALEKIRAEIGDSDAELLALVESPQPLGNARQLENRERFWSRVTYRPAGVELPPAVRQLMQQNRFLGPEALQTVVFEVDLDEDGRAEYALVRVMNGRFTVGRLYYQSDQGWQQMPLAYGGMGLTDEQVVESLSTGEISAVAPRFNDLQIGELRLGVGQGRGVDFLLREDSLPVD